MAHFFIFRYVKKLVTHSVKVVYHYKKSATAAYVRHDGFPMMHLRIAADFARVSGGATAEASLLKKVVKSGGIPTGGEGGEAFGSELKSQHGHNSLLPMQI